MYRIKSNSLTDGLHLMQASCQYDMIFNLSGDSAAEQLRAHLAALALVRVNNELTQCLTVLGNTFLLYYILFIFFSEEFQRTHDRLCRAFSQSAGLYL